jgi:hypothetical protein
MRSAMVVDAEIATSSGIPIAVAFCTISKLQRLDHREATLWVDMTSRHGADQLIESVVATDIFAHDGDLPSRGCGIIRATNRGVVSGGLRRHAR